MKDRTATDAIMAADQAQAIGYQPWPLQEKTVYTLIRWDPPLTIGVIQVNWWGVIAVLIPKPRAREFGVEFGGYATNNPPPDLTHVSVLAHSTILSIQWADVGVAEKVAPPLVPVPKWDDLVKSIRSPP